MGIDPRVVPGLGVWGWPYILIKVQHCPYQGSVPRHLLAHVLKYVSGTPSPDHPHYELYIDIEVALSEEPMYRRFQGSTSGFRHACR